MMHGQTQIKWRNMLVISIGFMDEKRHIIFGDKQPRSFCFFQISEHYT